MARHDQPDFQRLFEAAPGLYLVLSPELNVVAVNQAYLDATLTQRDSILGRHLFEIFPDNPGDPAADGVRNLRHSLDYVRGQLVPHTMAVQKYDIRRPDGSFEARYWSPVNTPVLRDGRLECIIHRVEDVTEFVRMRELGDEQSRFTKQLQGKAERMEAEILQRAKEIQVANRRLADANEELARLHKAEMQRQVNLFQEAIEASQEAFDLMQAIRDVHGRIVDFEIVQINSRTEQLTGYTREQMIGKRVCDLFPVTRDSGYLEQYIRVVETRKPWLSEFAINANNVNAQWLSQQVVAVGDGVAIFSRDISQQKKLEEQLLQSQKMESIGRLAGGVAHDFNNLLTVIIGYAELAGAKTKSANIPMLEGALKNILTAANRAAELTRQLLTFARKQVIELRVIDLNSLLGEAEKMLGRVIGEDVKLRVARGKDLWRCKADPGQVSQVLMNLTVNARDAMPLGGMLTIETANVVLDEAYCRSHQGTLPGDYVMLAVSDSGEGMSEETKRRAFEPFFTTKDVGKGTGLGLSTCYGIVKQHGGHISLYSEKGVGTTFKIYLPRNDLGETAVTLGKDAGVPEGQEVILLVEDESMVREYAAFTLRSFGYKVVHAPNGDTALKSSRELEGRIDLLVTDVIMPGLSGKALAETLVRERPGLKVLFCSGYTANTIVHHGVLDEDVNFLPKPFTPMALGRKVREVLDQKPS
ncbi:MAG: response regulator [Planctomycetes bacterium]|nr:response regulator [Planctomycetota bacterium]